MVNILKKKELFDFFFTYDIYFIYRNPWTIQNSVHCLDCYMIVWGRICPCNVAYDTLQGLTGSLTFLNQ